MLTRTPIHELSVGDLVFIKFDYDNNRWQLFTVERLVKQSYTEAVECIATDKDGKKLKCAGGRKLVKAQSVVADHEMTYLVSSL